ncbi:uncharacterized protein [Aristolochia californica]|uniref:uncharacterized protein n=1 Tax=Aristolochia californica TaxID=171875 RepID=UPI0035E27B1A
MGHAAVWMIFLDLLIHYGHSCLVPIDYTKIPDLYVFIEIKIDVDHIINTIKAFFCDKKIAVARTIQFSAVVRTVKSALADSGIDIIVPQFKPTIRAFRYDPYLKVFFLEEYDLNGMKQAEGKYGRFHLEAFMIANPHIRAFRYDPYLKVFFLEEYDLNGMKQAQKKEILNARKVNSWGIVHGTLGR